MSIRNIVLLLLLVFPLVDGVALDKVFRKHGLLFSHPDTYRVKVVEKKAVRVILDGSDARVGITIINRVVPDSLHEYVLDTMRKELKEKGLKRVSFTGRETVLLPFRNIKRSGSAFRSRYQRNNRFITTYIYIFSANRKTYMLAMTDKLGSTNTFDFFLETFRLEKEKKKKNK